MKTAISSYVPGFILSFHVSPVFCDFTQSHVSQEVTVAPKKNNNKNILVAEGLWNLGGLEWLYHAMLGHQAADTNHCRSGQGEFFFCTAVGSDEQMSNG